MTQSFNALAPLTVDGQTYHYYRLDALRAHGLDVARLPFSLKVLLENLLRHEDGSSVTADDIRGLARWDPKADPDREIAFRPSRVLLQDFTGVPAVVDLAAMRDAMKQMGGDPRKINPLQPVELVIDHSVQVDEAGTPSSFAVNAELEFNRNRERYAFLRWGQNAFENFKVVPPDTGIVHQVNLEYLARVVFTAAQAPGQEPLAYPDTLVGTDSHTTMINGLGVLGWGVGGIEAEAAMLGQPVSMLVPQVVGFKLTGTLPEGATATDLVLTVTQMLRKKGVVGKFVEYYGDGLASLPLADRATIANMAPEYGATCGIFPIDAETLRYLELSGRPKGLIRLVEAYYRAQGMFREPGAPEAHYSDTLALDLSTVQPSLAGPRRPQDRVALSDAKTSFHKALQEMLAVPTTKAKKSLAVASDAAAMVSEGGGLAESHSSGNGHVAEQLHHGSVVIAAITSCTNTSNPSVMLAAGLLAKEGRRAGTLDQALGQGEPGTRVEGGDRLPQGRRGRLRPRRPPVQPGRIRLHHLHRQLGSASPGHLRGDPEERPGGRGGAQREPQLRGPDQPRRPGQLSRLTPSGGRLRAGGHHGYRLRHRADRRGPPGQAGLPQGNLAEPEGHPGSHSQVGKDGNVPIGIWRGLPGRQAVEHAARPPGRPLRVGSGLDLREESALLRGDARRARPACPHHPGPGPGRAG